FLKPLDEALLHEVCSQYKTIVSLENGSVTGGLGSAISEFLSKHHYSNHLQTAGIPDSFIEQGTVEELHKECGLDYHSLLKMIEQLRTVLNNG
ncbi:MAG: 1-deoxy-D-xylulose-5-phosphate synthase, partial [Bacteroidales bacterium]|nr:1-deoxy-D-xylulose-5-phosphate synthase [Bacteroidales bacterium]